MHEANNSTRSIWNDKDTCQCNDKPSWSQLTFLLCDLFKSPSHTLVPLESLSLPMATLLSFCDIVSSSKHVKMHSSIHNHVVVLAPNIEMLHMHVSVVHVLAS
jgi:hypothetical protein